MKLITIEVKDNKINVTTEELIKRPYEDNLDEKVTNFLLGFTTKYVNRLYPSVIYTDKSNGHYTLF